MCVFIHAHLHICIHMCICIEKDVPDLLLQQLLDQLLARVVFKHFFRPLVRKGLVCHRLCACVRVNVCTCVRACPTIQAISSLENMGQPRRKMIKMRRRRWCIQRKSTCSTIYAISSLENMGTGDSEASAPLPCLSIHPTRSNASVASEGSSPVYKCVLFMDMYLHMYACVCVGGGSHQPAKFPWMPLDPPVCPCLFHRRLPRQVYVHTHIYINRYIMHKMICIHIYIYIGHHLNVSVRGAHMQRETLYTA